MTKTEEDFIKKIGPERFQRALTAATMHLRSDNRFVGMDKVRVPLAHCAAIRALGGKSNPPLLRSKKVAGTEEGVLLHQLFTETIEATRASLAA